MKFILFSFFLIIFHGLSSFAQSIQKIDIEKGVLTLKEIDFQNDIIVELGGDPYFYWGELFSINEINNKGNFDSFISISSSWNNQNDTSINFPAEGFGTYHFKVLVPESCVGKHFIIRPNHFIAYASEIFVNNNRVCHNGFVGKSKTNSSYNPSRKTIVNPFVADSAVLDVVIWVSNFNHFRGGIFQKFKLGLAESMIKQREKVVTYDLIIIISLFIMFLYHFILYFVNIRDKTALFFSLTCLVFALDLSFQDTMSFFILFPEAGFRISSFLHLSLPYLIPSSFIFFLHALFPDEVPKKIRNLTGIVSVVLVLITLTNVHSIYSLIVKPHLIYAFFIIIFVYFVAIKAVIKKRENAPLFLIAYIIFSFCALNDILFVFEIIYTARLMSTGLIVFVILLSMLQGKRFTQMYNRNVRLTQRLLDLNKGLELKVKQRTNELQLSMNKLNKLNQFKEDMTKMIIHDLKTPLNTIINIKHIKDDGIRSDMVQQSGYRMLNMIHNVLDVYRYENSSIELKKEKIQILDIVSKAREEVGISLNQKLLTVDIRVESNCFVNVDNEIIQRVFVNLLSNAVKYSPKNGIITITAIPLKNDKLKILISNQGPSIPKDQQKLIFSKFGQAEKDINTRMHSYGIGLAFCKLVIEAHKGKIGVESEENKDVVFWFTLPDVVYDEVNKNNNWLTEDHISLTIEESKKIKVYAERLSKYEVYQISAINKIFSEIKQSSIGIRKWLLELERVVYSGDKELYKKMLRF